MTSAASVEAELRADDTPNPVVEVAFCVSHAPQILLGPPEEDPAELAKVHDGYRHIAREASELKLDALCVVALDHLHNHFLDLVPMFTIFTGSPVVARFNEVEVQCEAAPDLANGLLDHVLASGFDPAFSQREVLDHSFLIPLHYAAQEGLRTPIIPVIINAYVPPQPSIQRCYALGRTIAEWAAANGIRLGVVATGGMSHYPGTSRFAHPDVAFDRVVLDWMRDGESQKLLDLTGPELDEHGMVEMRTWAIAIGARGANARANVRSYWDSGHCGYAVVEL